MYPELRFNEFVTIYSVTPDEYGKDVLGEGQIVSALFEQTTGYSHARNQDAVGSGSRVYLQADSCPLVTEYYRLEGMILKANPFGAPEADQYFRISRVTAARDILNNNLVRHVECELDKSTDFGNESCE